MKGNNVVNFTEKRRRSKHIKNTVRSCRFRSLDSFSRSIGAEEESVRVMVRLDSDAEIKAVAKVLGYVAHQTGLPLRDVLKSWPEIRNCLKKLPLE